MSATPPSAAEQTASSIENILVFAASSLFPGVGPFIGIADKALDIVVPYIIQAVQGKKFTLEELRVMQRELNAFGPSFPGAGGYTNIAGGAVPALGVVGGQAAPTSATVTLKPGVVVTITSATVEGLVSLLGQLIPSGGSVPVVSTPQ